MSTDANLWTELETRTERLLECVAAGALEKAWKWVREREDTLSRLAGSVSDARALENARRLDTELTRAARAELEAVREELDELRAQRRALDRLRRLRDAGPRFLSHRA